MFGFLKPKTNNKQVDTNKALARWWQVFNADDKKRAAEDIFYLPCNLETAGNSNAGRMKFEIPHDKMIMISVVNAIAMRRHDELTPEMGPTMLKDVNSRMDEIKDQFVRVNGKDLTKHANRLMSRFFDLDYDYRAITDGYWLFLPPNTLPVGEHTIDRMACRQNGREASTHYDITIT